MQPSRSRCRSAALVRWGDCTCRRRNACWWCIFRMSRHKFTDTKPVPIFFSYSQPCTALNIHRHSRRAVLVNKDNPARDASTIKNPAGSLSPDLAGLSIGFQLASNCLSTPFNWVVYIYPHTPMPVESTGPVGTGRAYQPASMAMIKLGAGCARRSCWLPDT